VLDSVAEAVVMADPDGRILVCNPAAERLLGPRPVELGVAPEGGDQRLVSSAAAIAPLRRALAGELVAPEERLAWHEQERRDLWLAVSARPITDSEGEIAGAVAVAQDVTQRRHGEHAQRLESLGRLAGGVAHEVNNVLQLIANSSYIMLDELADLNGGVDTDAIDELRQDAEDIRSTALRGGELAGQLLTFSRRSEPVRARLDLPSVMSSCDRLVARLLGHDVTVSIECAENLPRVMADEGQIQQVLLNLAANARDAMAEGGSFSVRVDPVEAGQPGTPPLLTEGRWVRLTATDTGCGIAPEIRDLIFEPFFTTKAPNVGTGLGLATVYAIVRDSGGHIQVSSRVGEGATFTLYLPAAE
jgi:PAS domain S-box-containing protein